MNTSKITLHINFVLISLASMLFFVPNMIKACTIISAVASDGQVWNANNEDGPSRVANFINVFPKSENAKFGYYTLSYMSPAYGQGGSMQGGMNEAGLTFDFNAIDRVEGFDSKSREVFPKGDEEILPHILKNMSSVKEVISFFETYWFQNGFRSAQMHVADRQGRFAIISASGIQLVEKGQPLVSTNFDICGNEDGSSCWRYPIATAKLSTLGASLSTMKAICHETAQKNGITMYSNIQNLSTGDVWFFSKHDPNITVSTNIDDILSKVRKSFTFSDLRSLTEDRQNDQWFEPNQIVLLDDAMDKFEGKYHNSLTGEISIKKEENGIQLSFMDGRIATFYPQSASEFYLPDAGMSIKFVLNKKDNQMEMNFYENGYWSFSALGSISNN